MIKRSFLAGAIVSGIAFLVVSVGVVRAWWSMPFPVFGMGAAPAQPIDFPHAKHIDAGVQCEFCHRVVSVGAAATVPSVEQCMLCHKDLPNGRFVGEGSAAVQLLRIDSQNQAPVDWARVHRVPDHVHFTHEPHYRFFAPKLADTRQVCARCHGDVGSMTRVKQVVGLKMNNCVNCHRQNNAPTDCATCHY